jgi:sugar transferase (PEP-CTERM/EpsH1 system associated)
MRILMLAHRIPYPPHTGDKVRAYHVARHLARHHDVTLAFLVDDRADLAGLYPLSQMVRRLEYARLWKPWSTLKGLIGLAGGSSLSVPYFGSRRLRRRLAERIATDRYDLIYASSTPTAQYAEGLGIPVVMDFVDIDSDKWIQYGRHTAPPRSWIYQIEGRRLQECEAAIARWAALCVLATPVEESLLKSFAPWATTAVVANGIDLSYHAPMGEEPNHPAILFTGAMDYLPNVDAVQYFCDEILPLVRREVRDTAFLIVGKNPSPEVRRLAGIPGVVVSGSVPDVRPYYARAGVCVAPLRLGRGVQNKVLQGMAMGIAVVTTTVGARGIDAQGGCHFEVADEPAEFAAHLVRLLRDPGQRKRLARNGRGFVEANHAWESSFARMDGLLVEAAKRPGGSARRVHRVSASPGRVERSRT